MIAKGLEVNTGIEELILVMAHCDGHWGCFISLILGCRLKIVLEKEVLI